MTDETILPVRPRRAAKSASAFRTISEVADELGLEQHVLRFWETKFAQIKPMKRGGGRRYYRPEDVVLLENIRDLLRTDGYTIKGVQRLLKEGRLSKGTSPDPAAPLKPQTAKPQTAPSRISPPPSPPVRKEVVPDVTPQLFSDAQDDGPATVSEPVMQDKLRSVLHELQEIRRKAALVAENTL